MPRLIESVGVHKASSRTVIRTAALKRLQSLPASSPTPSRRHLAAMLLDEVPLSLPTIRSHLKALDIP